MIKKCKKCNKDLDINMFYKDKTIKSGYMNTCKICHNIHTINLRKKRYKNRPWDKKLASAAQRKYLGFNLTSDGLKNLWYRDKAYDMKNPSIDRINPKKGYLLDNCQFLELSENTAKDQRGSKHYNVVINEKIARKIKLLHKDGISNGDIARKLNIKYYFVQNIVIGNQWKHVIV